MLETSRQGGTLRSSGRDPAAGALVRLAAVLSLAAVLAGLDATIVSVGIDAVGRDLGGPLADLQWVATGYLLAVSMVMPLSGWLADRFGGRAMWLMSVALFVAGSALCGCAWSVPALVVFRVVQGIGGGLMQPIGQAILARAAGPERLARIVSVVIVPVMFAPVAGPVLGGLIVQHLDWRWLFLVNLPVGLLTLLAAVRTVPAEPPSGPRGDSLDVVGLVLLSPGLSALVYGLSEAGEHGAGAVRAVVALFAGAVLLVAYGVHALRSRGTPLVDLRLFARRSFTAATANAFFLGAATYGSMLVLPLYFQQVRHENAFQAGLSLAPQALGTAAIAYFAGRLVERIGARSVALLGTVLAAVATIPLMFVGTGLNGGVMIIALVVRGLGLGAAMAPGMAVVYGSVEKHQVSQASTALNVLNRVGGSIGIAVLALALQHGLASAGQPVATAYGTTFIWAFALAVISILPVLALPRRNTTKKSARTP